MPKPATAEHLPRLLDLDDSPSPHRQRPWWKHLHRWRNHLFHVWRRDSAQELADSTIAEAVDDVIGMALLVEYLRRTGCFDLPTISEVGGNLAVPTLANITAAYATRLQNRILAVVFEPKASTTVPLPMSILSKPWEKRLRDALWLAFADRRPPLSFFGDLHQFCTGNPLPMTAAHSDGPSARRSRGMFYTPAPIVDYLVFTSLNQLLADRTPGELSQLRVLDPSCGCGAFLIGCIRLVLQRLAPRPPGASPPNDQYSLRFLGQVFHGCDIDSRALRWTKRLLALAVWESIQDRIELSTPLSDSDLPGFGQTLHCGSFLEPPNDCNTNLLKPGYDLILGGPPFVRLEALQRSQGDRLRSYRRRFLSARHGQFDLYMLFIEQAIDLLKPEGLLAFSLSNSFLRSEGGRHLRGYIAANASVEEIVELDDSRVYADASTQIALLRLRKTRKRATGRYILARGRGQLRQKLDHLVSGCPDSELMVLPLEARATASSRWCVISQDDSRWLEAMKKMGMPLGKLLEVEYGPSTGMDEIFLLRRNSQTVTGVVLGRRRGEKRTIPFEAMMIRSVIRGHQVREFGKRNLPNMCPFPFDDQGQPFSEAELRARFPLTYGYLCHHQHLLSQRLLAKGCPWYSTFSRLPGKTVTGERLMGARITEGGGLVLVKDPTVVAHSSVVVFIPRNDGIDMHYLLGLLNSRVFARYISLTMPRISAGRFSLRLSWLRRFPIPTAETDAEKAICDRIASWTREQLASSSHQQVLLPDAIESDIVRLYEVAI